MMIHNKISDVTNDIAGSIRLASMGAVAAALVAISPIASRAQTYTGAKPPLSAALAVPTTKLLAIGSFTAKAAPNVRRPILPSEMRETARLYLAGKIDQWYVKQDQSGVVFIMNTDPKEAHELLAKLPLGQGGLMEFQIISLAAISPIASFAQAFARVELPAYSSLVAKSNRFLGERK
jgi:hypothetical protein